MVFVITGTAESDTVGRLLADDLGWEFIDTKKLTPPANFDARKPSTSLANTTLRIEALSAAINTWIFEWRDVVVSCPMLTENDRRRLSEISSLVKLIRLKPPHVIGRTPSLDQSAHVVSPEYSDERRATRPPERETLTVDSSGQSEEVVAEIVSALVLKRRSV